MNALNEQRIATLAPEFQALAKQVVLEASEAVKPLGYTVLVTNGRRTIAEQNDLYAKGRTKKGPVVTNARGGSSPHNFGLAFDFALCKDGVPQWKAPREHWQIVGDIAKSHGLVWGGDFKSLLDLPHIEATDWKLAQAAWKAGALEVA